jgi:hypothetical protein
MMQRDRRNVRIVFFRRRSTGRELSATHAESFTLDSPGWLSFRRWRWLRAYRDIFVEATMWQRWFLWLFVLKPLAYREFLLAACESSDWYASAIRMRDAQGANQSKYSRPHGRVRRFR